ncbi:MAG: phospholipase D family protein [Burkholderiales bacterium]|nr:phospholipase D family protein [Burkholderiales bacterium]MDR4515987.1 phospholipase D family protein [Nitrosomonas sp.]
MLVDAQQVRLLQNSQYIRFLRQSLENAKSRVLVLQFLVDVRPQEDTFGEVRYLLNSIAEASADGLDVRVLLAQILVDHPTPRDLNEVAATYLRRRDVRVRQLCDPCGQQQHAKAILLDDVVIVGSHNWTPAAFRLNEETSLAISSPSAARIFADRFDHLWELGSGSI